MLFTCNINNNLNDLFLTKTTNCFLFSILISINRSNNLFFIKCYNSLFTNEKENICFDVNYMYKLSILNIIKVEKSDESKRKRNCYLSTTTILLITKLLTTIEHR